MISDFFPFITQIVSMWLAAKHKWEDLATATLENPALDRSTIVGSNMLGGLRDDLAVHEIRSTLLKTEALSGSYRGPDFSDIDFMDS